MNKEDFVTRYLELVSPRPTRTEGEVIYHEYKVSSMTDYQVHFFLHSVCNTV